MTVMAVLDSCESLPSNTTGKNRVTGETFDKNARNA